MSNCTHSQRGNGGISGDPLQSASFDLEDPRGRLHKIDLLSVSSWEEFNVYLLRVFPPGDPGHGVIRSRCYLIHSTSPEVDPILCTSPGVDTLQTHKSLYEERCPKCRIKRQANMDIVVICNNCNLRLRLQESRDAEPDPITQLAMNDIIRSSGKRSFLQQSITEASRSLTHLDPSSVERLLESWMRANLEELRQSAPLPSADPKDEIKHFNRYSNAEDLPFAKAAAMVNTRFWFARLEQAKVRFLKLILKASGIQETTFQMLVRAVNILNDYITQVNDATAQFQPSVLKTRCLLWIFSDVLLLEGNILHGCSTLLAQCGCSLPKGIRREKTPLLLKILTLPHIILLVPWRLTIDLVEDIATAFEKDRHFQLPFAIQQLVMRSDVLSLQFYLVENLNKYFEASHPRQTGEDGELDPLQTREDRELASDQPWMEAVMRSRGLGLKAPYVARQLYKLMEDGYPTETCLVKALEKNDRITRSLTERL
ncbi:hypothetical protein F5Y16DRAFT_394879 [Xylariaceae sp. FL0255]|nr:hypothetical protein F5Y16DRAFT_394879 [Xylariaceae sp. FL0255]